MGGEEEERTERGGREYSKWVKLWRWGRGGRKDRSARVQENKEYILKQSGKAERGRNLT